MIIDGGDQPVVFERGHQQQEECVEPERLHREAHREPSSENSTITAAISSQPFVPEPVGHAATATSRLLVAKDTEMNARST